MELISSFKIPFLGSGRGREVVGGKTGGFKIPVLLTWLGTRPA